jgi:calcineurin-like phosphoesterase family protein
MTFFIGDNHFYDENIIKFENRPFSTVEEMNTFMINQWNSAVHPTDTVIVVGDFFDLNNCTGPEASKIIEELNGNIILIVGNHDKPFLDFYRSCHADKIEVIEYPIIYKNFWMVSHEPMYVNENMPYANIFAHVHNNPMYKTISCRSYCVSAERLNYIPILDSALMHSVKNCK